MRRAYLFHLHRLCHLDDAGIDDLYLIDFANLTDSIDGWISVELHMKEVTLFG